MRGLMLAGAVAALALGGASTVATAQVLGGQVGGALGGTVGGLGGAGASVDGAARIDPALPDATRAVDETARTTARATARTARDAKAVHVDAGASVRVARGSRCYYDDYYYDPAYRDGYYYCERTGPSAGVSVGAGAHP